jgi:BirA family transcriptional regulator, biotin operon repressor / biotin---[acetyl-CoA-carboxylase] ligase
VTLAARLAQTLPEAGSESFRAAVSGEALGRALGLSRAAVHKHVEQLRSLGFAVEPVAGTGYRLKRPFSDLVVAEAVLPLLLDIIPLGSPWTAGLPYRYLPRCDSTNAVLKRVSTPTPPGTLVVTDEQTGGRGRLDRTWVSELGKDLTFSILLRPSLAPAQAHLLSLAAALAVAEVLETIPGLEGRVAVKWPNDVLLGDRKVCGILLEGSMDADRLQWAVAGIGLNVNSAPSALVRGLAPEEAKVWMGRPLPVSLREHLGRDVARGPLLAALLERLTSRWIGLEPEGDHGSGSGEVSDVLAGLRQRDALAGRRVEVVSGPPQHSPVVAGEALGIGPEGQLLVRSSSGETVAVFAGDVTVRAALRSREEPMP